ncbi:hypothetical protein C9374_014577 [Naegleria lovaniensis]|uniref:Uncharacterized protein n=1 Tax=Naegleria lovaniensis TaxID=51637 RepID=A0AA88GY26_NAELO|nr:uncharacterized protein C9374_014577 [Naegleria lovaniensis]KAG2389177.1 hypothetical protein C9374_014577 [Naegleria lovaniensis]
MGASYSKRQRAAPSKERSYSTPTTTSFSITNKFQIKRTGRDENKYRVKDEDVGTEPLSSLREKQGIIFNGHQTETVQIISTNQQQHGLSQRENSLSSMSTTNTSTSTLSSDDATVHNNNNGIVTLKIKDTALYMKYSNIADKRTRPSKSKPSSKKESNNIEVRCPPNLLSVRRASIPVPKGEMGTIDLIPISVQKNRDEDIQPASKQSRSLSPLKTSRTCLASVNNEPVVICVIPPPEPAQDVYHNPSHEKKRITLREEKHRKLQQIKENPLKTWTHDDLRKLSTKKRKIKNPFADEELLELYCK